MNDQHQRAFFNDYSQPRIYMITLATVGRKPLLGSVIGNPRTPHGNKDAPKVKLTPIGWEVSRQIAHIKWAYPQISTPAWQLMPDHVHFIINVKEALPIHLNSVIYNFINECNKHNSVINGPDQPPLFEYNYHDRILSGKGQLQKMVDYIHDNPRRHLIRHLYQDYFTIRVINWEGETLQTFGNLKLLYFQNKMPVRISRRNNEDQIQQLAQQYLLLTQQGTILVSPFVSPGEKLVKEKALETGAPVIIILDNGIPPLFKPSGLLFEQCALGKILLITSFEYSSSKITPTKQRFEQMNMLAIKLCKPI